MASSEKTPALGLNRWRGTDIPMREDFVADNEILDTAISALQSGGSGAGGNDPRLDGHLGNQEVHVSAGDRALLTALGEGGGNGPLIGTYTGNGSMTQGIALGFRPRFGVVFADERALIETGSNGLFQISRCGIVTNSGNSRGIDGHATGFRVHDWMAGSATGTDYMGLNQAGQRYVYAMWR
ncbi:MAG: hypothetical protein FWE32_10770 [Oscillospiraceae bacterium]|nr:hypothetical protein [Oscillospiraceae bacterium]